MSDQQDENFQTGPQLKSTTVIFLHLGAKVAIMIALKSTDLVRKRAAHCDEKECRIARFDDRTRTIHYKLAYHYHRAVAKIIHDDVFLLSHLAIIVASYL